MPFTTERVPEETAPTTSGFSTYRVPDQEPDVDPSMGAPFTDPRVSIQPQGARLGRDVLAGLGEGGHDLLKAILYPTKFVAPPVYKAVSQWRGFKDFDYMGAVGPKKPQLIDKMISGITSTLPTMGVAAAAPEALAPELMERGGLKAILARIGAQTAGGGIYGGAEEGPAGAIIGGSLGALGEGLGAATQAYSPMRYFRQLVDMARKRGKISGGIRAPEEIRQVATSLKDVPAHIGDIIGGQPTETRESIRKLYGATGSGMKDRAFEAKAAIDNQAADTFKEMGGNPGNIILSKNNEIIQDLKDIHEGHRSDFATEFEDIANTADARDVGIKLNHSNLKKTASQILKDDEKRVISHLDPAIKSQIKDILKPAAKKAPTFEETFLGIEPAQEEIPKTFQNAHFAHSDLGATKRNLIAKQDFGSAKVIRPLQESLQQDITNALDKKGMEDLKPRWDAARTGFREKVVPFRDKTLSKILEGETAPKNIASQLTNQKAKMNEVLGLLPQDIKDKILYQNLIKGISNKGPHPVTLSNEYQKLFKKAPDLEKILTTPEQRIAFEKLHNMLKGTTELRAILDRPPTGVQAADAMAKAAQKLPEGLAGLGAIGAGVAGEPVAATALVGGLIAKIGLNRFRQWQSMSPGIRQKFLKTLLDDKATQYGLLNYLGTGARLSPFATVPAATQTIGQQ